MIMTSRLRVVALVGGLMESAPPPLAQIEAMASLEVVSDAESLARSLPTADVLFIWDYRYANIASLLGQASRLRWIQVASVGVDPILSPEFLASDIVLTNSRGVFDAAIAEYVAGLLLAHSKDLWVTRAKQAGHEWNQRLTRRLTGQRVVVVGTGSIGRQIAHMLKLLGVEVELVGRRAALDPVFGAVRPSTELAAVVAGADALVLAAPLTVETRGLVDAKVLRALGPQGYLVNVARGPMVREVDLLDALRSGGISGAALDVFDTEPLPGFSPFWSLPTVVVSPHMSAEFVGFEGDLVDIFADNLRRWVQGQPLANVVDKALGYVPSIRPAPQ